MASVRFLFCSLALSLLLPGLATAHLALLRQGTESGDVPNTDDKFGSTVVTGDFNRDGYDDLATAATWEANGLVNTAAHGMVSINYGSYLGLTHLGHDVISPGAPVDNSIKFGFAMAVGDFNGDDYDDLAVGGIDADFLGIVNCGAVWIYDGFSGGLELAPSRIIYQHDVGAADEDFDHFGWSLQAGDFDGDGFDDLAIGGIGENDDMGAIYVVYSAGNSGLDPALAPDIWTPASLGFSAGTLGGWFGHAMTSADYDEDGFEDLVVSAPKSDIGGIGDSGRLYFFYGSAVGLSTTDLWTYDNVTQSWPALDQKLELGWSLASGHFSDTAGARPISIAAGVPAYEHNGNAGAGGVLWMTHDDTNRSYGGSAGIRVQETGLDYDDVLPSDRYGESLAAGKFNPGQYDDLAVGVTGDDIEEQAALGQQGNAGSVYLYEGSATGLGAGVHIIHTTLNDHVSGSDQLGKSLAFGRFDHSQNQALAIGAPGGDYPSYEGDPTIFGAGRVYIHAPWRQPRGRPHRGSAAYDCQGRLVYSQRAWQRLRPASTTKTMTLLLACEAIANGQDPNEMFLVLPWVSQGPGGSQVPLFAGELMSFSNLMKTMMTVSGNDAAMLLGSIMAGEGIGTVWNGWSGTAPGFATMMETRATQLGLSGSTSLTNAAGIDSGDHYVTPADWAWLVYQNIQNPCVKDVVNTSPWLVPRVMPFDLFGEWISFVNNVQFNFFNGFVDGVKSRNPNAVGNKGGSTPGAIRTGVFNSNPPGPGGQTGAGAFGIWGDDNPFPGIDADCNSCTGAELLEVAENACQDFVPNDIQAPPVPPTPWGTLTNWDPEDGGDPIGLGFQVNGKEDDTDGRVIQIDVLRGNYTYPTSTYRQAVHRVSDLCLPDGGSEDFGVAPYQGHHGFRIVNRGDNTIDLRVSTTHPVSSTDITLAPENEFVIAPDASGPAASFMLSILNMTLREEACIEVEELGYLFEITLGDGIGVPDVSSILLNRPLGTDKETISAFFEGRDVAPGNILDISAHEPNVPVGIGEDGFVPAAPRPATARLLPNHPNPFNPSTLLRFDLDIDGLVDLAIYDAQGRLVRTIKSGERMERGRHQLQWNGTDDGGRAVASGVYYLRLDASGATDSQRLVLVK